MRTSTLGLVVLGCVFWIGADAGSQPIAKKKAPSEPEDLLKERRDRQKIEEQRFAEAVNDAIRRAGRNRADDPDGSVQVLKDLLRQVKDHPDLEEQARNAIITRIESALPGERGNPPKLKFKKPADTDTAVRRWEYHVHIHTPGEAALNKLGAEGWDLAGIEPARQGFGALYIFRRPATGKPKADEKPAPEQAPKGKEDVKLELRVYRLKFANATDMVQIVDAVLRPNKNSARIAADPRSNQVVVNAPMEAHGEIEALLQRLDVPADEARPPGGAGPPPGGGKKKKR